MSKEGIFFQVKLTKGCSFCLKAVSEVANMIIAETGARICDECIGLCVEQLDNAAESD